MIAADVEIYVDPSHAMLRLAMLRAKLQAAGLEMFMQTVVVPWVQRRTSDRFSNEGDEVSGRWLPLSRATQLIRAKKGFSPAHPINVRTHQMRDFLETADGSITGGPGYSSLNWPGNLGRVKEIDRKIRTAQGQTPGTPARPVIGLGQADDFHITTQLLIYLLS